jgi:hypothetical protein
MNVRKVALYAGAILLALPMVASAAGPKAGKWQVTMEMDMPGMPMKMPPQTFTQCITKEQAENPQETLPKASRNQNSDCKLQDYKVDGNKVTWKLECPKEKMTGTGSASYENDAYTATMHMSMPDHEMTMKYAGKRIGDCDK